MPHLSFPRILYCKVVAGYSLLALLLIIAAPVSCTAGDENYRTDQYRFPRFGGYLPQGGFQPDGENPWGGYAPYTRNGGRAKLTYGAGYSDFGPSYRFGYNDPSNRR
ncbi:MAG: hypothetical protein EXS05_12705 [Planctomycetaceae bacterium]|nr:hypothetical protein [Planctomycetaceae bacterium]